MGCWGTGRKRTAKISKSLKDRTSKRIRKPRHLNNISLIRRFSIQYPGIFLIVSGILTRPTGSAKYSVTCKKQSSILHPKPSNKIHLSFVLFLFFAEPRTELLKITEITPSFGSVEVVNFEFTWTGLFSYCSAKFCPDMTIFFIATSSGRI